MTQPVVFISYSHKDEAEKDKLISHLNVLERAGFIGVWNDDEIGAGEDWEGKIGQAMEQAAVAILLVSADFLASDFIARREVPRLLERRCGEGLAVFPVIAKACAWRQIDWLVQLNVRPKNGRPVWSDEGSHVDEDLAAIVEEVAGLIRSATEVRPPADFKAPEPVLPAPPSPTAPAPLEPVTGEPVKKGFTALGELLRQDDEAREAVIAFRLLFEAAGRQIQSLSDYKNLHDLLHTLQLHCYDRIVQEAEHFPDGDSVLENLLDHELTLQSVTEGLREAVNQGTFAENEVSWIRENLEPAGECLRQALETSDIKPLKRAAWLLNHVLAIQPARINTKLNQVARDLRLPGLVEAMTAVYEKLRALKLDPERVRQFSEGVAALARLNQRLTALVNDHDRWQAVDSDLRLIERNLKEYLQELEFSWPNSKARIESLCGDSRESWALAFKADGERLESAIAAQNPEKVRQYFRRYRRQAGDRFYRVDITLKRQCDELREAGEPLASMLRMIA